MNNEDEEIRRRVGEDPPWRNDYRPRPPLDTWTIIFAGTLIILGIFLLILLLG